MIAPGQRRSQRPAGRDDPRLAAQPPPASGQQRTAPRRPCRWGTAVSCRGLDGPERPPSADNPACPVPNPSTPRPRPGAGRSGTCNSPASARRNASANLTAVPNASAASSTCAQHRVPPLVHRRHRLVRPGRWLTREQFINQFAQRPGGMSGGHRTPARPPGRSPIATAAKCRCGCARQTCRLRRVRIEPDVNPRGRQVVRLSRLLALAIDDRREQAQTTRAPRSSSGCPGCAARPPAKNPPAAAANRDVARPRPGAGPAPRGRRGPSGIRRAGQRPQLLLEQADQFPVARRAGRPAPWPSSVPADRGPARARRRAAAPTAATCSCAG